MFGFRIIITVVLLLLQSLVYFTFVRYLKTTKIYKPAYRWYAAIPFLVFNGSFIVISFAFGRSFYPPEWFKLFCLYPFYIWEGATFLIALWLLIGKIIKLPFHLGHWIGKLTAKLKPLEQGVVTPWNRKLQTVDLSRRKFLRTATFAFSAYAFGAATYGAVRTNAYEINYKEIKINNLPPELKGTTITLFSDIHAGQYMTEKDMRLYAEAVNELQSDIICIPGDFVNFQSEDAKGVARSFRDLKAKYGIYGSLGNHDYFQNADYVTQVLNNESPIKLLRHAHEKLTINGKNLYILGAEDTVSAGAGGFGIILDYLDKTAKDLNTMEINYTTSPKILLCHKPYAFDEMAKRDIDLVLSGHTHGGQVVPVKFGSFNLSFAAFVSKYIEGLYKLGNVNMYVSRGIGTVALPIRINCPPEITKITLI
jgi:uncharacterized protein